MQSDSLTTVKLNHPPPQLFQSDQQDQSEQNYQDSNNIHKQKRAKQLQDLQLQLTFSNVQLLQLTFNDQKFIQTIKNYNSQALEFMTQEDYEKALIYLQEGEKILEYAASCGKTIDRFLILHTLHNQASAYQKLWELEKSADYMEAIIYNIQTYIEHCQTIQIDQNLLEEMSEPHKHFSSLIYRRQLLALYSLQYSAVNSQIAKHDIAIESVKMALSVISGNLSLLQKYESLSLKSNQKSELQKLNKCCLGLQKQSIKSMLRNIRTELKKQRQNSPTFDQYLTRLRKFSIGQIMQIQPVSFETINKIESINNMISKEGKIKIALNISVCYYAIATEMRLLNTRNSILNPAEKTQQFQKSKIYHANAIKIALTFVPCVTEYLQHIVKSFKNNYRIDLNVQSINQTERVIQQSLKWQLLNDRSLGLIMSEDINEIGINSNEPGQQTKNKQIKLQEGKCNKYQLVLDMNRNEKQLILKPSALNALSEQDLKSEDDFGFDSMQNNKNKKETNRKLKYKIQAEKSRQKSKQKSKSNKKIKKLSSSENLKLNKVGSQSFVCLTDKFIKSKDKDSNSNIVTQKKISINSQTKVRKSERLKTSRASVKKFGITPRKQNNYGIVVRPDKFTRGKKQLKQITARDKQSKSRLNFVLINHKRTGNSFDRTKDQTKKAETKKHLKEMNIHQEYQSNPCYENYENGILSTHHKSKSKNKVKKMKSPNHNKAKITQWETFQKQKAHSKSKNSRLGGLKSPKNKKNPHRIEANKNKCRLKDNKDKDMVIFKQKSEKIQKVTTSIHLNR